MIDRPQEDPAPHGYCYDYSTGAKLRAATAEERRTSEMTNEHKGVGLIQVQHQGLWFTVWVKADMNDRILLDGNGLSLKLYLESKGIEADLTEDASSGTQVIRYATPHEAVVDAWLAGYVAGWS